MLSQIRDPTIILNFRILEGRPWRMEIFRVEGLFLGLLILGFRSLLRVFRVEALR